MRKRNDGHCYRDEKYLEIWWGRSRLADNGCWEWQHTVTEDGYGILGFRGQMMTLHRASYWLSHGLIPEGYHIHHACNNRLCWRPDHLEALPPDEHYRHTRPRTQLRTHCRQGHELTPDNIMLRPGRKRNGKTCLTCHKARVAEGEIRRKTDAAQREKRQAWRKEYNRAYKQRKKEERQQEKAS